MLPYDRIATYMDPTFLRLDLEQARVLVIGCGLSALGEELYDQHAGRVKEILSVDISPYCIEHMRQRSVHRPCMRFAVEDMTHSGLATASFEVAVDKGVLDDVLAFTRCEVEGQGSPPTTRASGWPARCCGRCAECWRRPEASM